jgi:hypothetical protein
MLAFSLRGEQADWQHRVGSVLTPRRGAASITPQPMQITRPDGTTGFADIESSLDGNSWRYSATNLSGFYAVRGGRDGEAVHYAVNVDSAESDLAMIGGDELPAEVHVRSTPNSDHSATADLITRSNWQQPLLACAVALLFVESVLAWRFGRGVA